MTKGTLVPKMVDYIFDLDKTLAGMNFAKVAAIRQEIACKRVAVVLGLGTACTSI